MMREGAAAAARHAVPEADIVDVPAAEDFETAFADGLRGEVLFASWFGHPVFDHLDELGVRWMHVSATGLDAWPRHLLEGRIVTCARRERDPDLRVRAGIDAGVREGVPARLVGRASRTLEPGEPR